jgi:hypothetical protein
MRKQEDEVCEFLEARRAGTGALEGARLSASREVA